ncbi:MAG: hypothetical protein KDA89_19470, partial [Planctomycetaceae bacterium]|nr:hypothetical protein [Planctomycetaceae bacterium]
CVPRDGHILVTSQEKALSDEMLENRVYDFSRLRGPLRFPADSTSSSPDELSHASRTQISGPDISGQLESLATVIHDMTSPQGRWMIIDGEGGAIAVAGNTLVIRQTYLVHREIESLLHSMLNPHFQIVPVNGEQPASVSRSSGVAEPQTLLAMAGWLVAVLVVVSLQISKASSGRTSTDIPH